MIATVIIMIIINKILFRLNRFVVNATYDAPVTGQLGDSLNDGALIVHRFLKIDKTKLFISI